MSTKNSNDTSWDRTSDLPICSTALCYRGPHYATRILSMKNSNDTSWDRTSDLPICSTALCYRGPHYATRMLCQRKIPVTPAGIEPATFRFVTHRLNHCATAVFIMLLECPRWLYHFCASCDQFNGACTPGTLSVKPLPPPPTQHVTIVFVLRESLVPLGTALLAF